MNQSVTVWNLYWNVTLGLYAKRTPDNMYEKHHIEFQLKRMADEFSELLYEDSCCIDCVCSSHE